MRELPFLWVPTGQQTTEIKAAARFDLPHHPLPILPGKGAIGFPDFCGKSLYLRKPGVEIPLGHNELQLSELKPCLIWLTEIKKELLGSSFLRTKSSNASKHHLSWHRKLFLPVQGFQSFLSLLVFLFGATHGNKESWGNRVARKARMVPTVRTLRHIQTAAVKHSESFRNSSTSLKSCFYF